MADKKKERKKKKAAKRQTWVLYTVSHLQQFGAPLPSEELQSSKRARSEANKSETLANEPTATEADPQLALAAAHTQGTPHGFECEMYKFFMSFFMFCGDIIAIPIAYVYMDGLIIKT